MASKGHKKKDEKAAYLASLLAWLIPGAGHWYMGMPKRAVIIFVTICSTFFLGLVLGSIEIIDPQYSKAWFCAQSLSGLPSLICAAVQDPAIPITQIYGRGVDLGQVYTGVAGFLNILCVLDVLGRHHANIDSDKFQ